ncbi:Legume-specific protein [Melia azedarach]|uniref:Legume-specific protein n=1 Tax=Melia azedarach TaxID=155640 RepID=A0ACC1Y6X8_MELAZ|nr:Legume-specific protein [Melia azedarach]
MEGIIPFIYRVFIQYRAAAAAAQPRMADSWFCESPPFPYIRLPGDSGYFMPQPEPAISSPSSSSRSVSSTGCLSTLRFTASRRAFS